MADRHTLGEDVLRQMRQEFEQEVVARMVPRQRVPEALFVSDNEERQRRVPAWDLPRQEERGMIDVFRAPAVRLLARRPGHVYLYLTYCVDDAGMPTAEVENGYVGQSFRLPGARDAEHRNGRFGDPTLVSPWEDVIVPGSPIIIAFGDYTQAELDALEQRYIRERAPRYNDRFNEARADRCRRLQARRERDARDAAKGLTPRRWPPVVAARPASPSWWRSRLVWWLLVWAAVSVGVAFTGLFAWWQCPLVAAVVVAGVWVWWQVAGRRRVRRLFRLRG